MATRVAIGRRWSKPAMASTEEGVTVAVPNPAVEALITSTVTLSKAEWELLRSVAWQRRKVGRPSVSKVLRELVQTNEAKLRSEVEQGWGYRSVD